MSEAPLPGVRASDADRNHVVEVLREQYGLGRLTLAEFEDRCEEALAARTYDDLEQALRELPHPPVRYSPLRAPGVEAAVPERTGDLRRAHRQLRESTRGYVVVNGFLVFIWAVTGHGYFWPVWPMAGWGLGLVGQVFRVRDLRRGGA